MTSTASKRFYESVNPEVARAILEGQQLRIFAAKVSVVREGEELYFAVDTLPRDGRPKEWERTTRKICRILKDEVERLPVETKAPLAALAHLMPEDTPIPLIQVETWISMRDDGGSWWTVTAALDLAAVCLPEVVRASERAKKRVLREVCKL